jgi:membrane protease YdiL (CAAX protease family)
VAALILGLAFLGHRYLTMGIGVLLLDAFMLVTLAPLYRQHRLRVRDLGLRTTAPARAVGLVAIAFLAVAITNALWLHGVLDKPAQSLGITLHAGTIDTILIGAGLTVSAPVIEEIFFRGLLYRVLRNRMSIIPAAVIAGFVFGAVHGMAYPLNTLPPRMVFGVIACLLYERTGLPIPLHGASRTHRWQCIRSRGQPPGRDRLRRVWRSRSHPPAVCRHPALLSRPSIPASRVGDRTPHHRP